MRIQVSGRAWIRLEDLSAVDAESIRRRLTLVDSVKRSAMIHRSYVESEGLLGIPRAFFRNRLLAADKIVSACSTGDAWPPRIPAADGDPWKIAQDGSDDELSLVDALTGVKSPDMLSGGRDGSNSILAALGPEESGEALALFPSEAAAIKVCLAIIKTLKLRTLVLVTPGASMTAWVSAMQMNLPDARVGIAPESTPDAHVTIGTIDSLRRAAVSGQIRSDEFGLIISHFIDRIDPAAWERAIVFFSAAKRIGVATRGARFDSGLSRIFGYHLGSPVFCADPEIEIPKVRRCWSTWKISAWVRVNPQFVSKENLLDHMCLSTTYNQEMVEQIVMAMKAERKILVVSERAAHLRTLKLLIEAAWSGGPRVVDFALDGLSPEDIETAISADVILTTFSYVKSMPEISQLDTVVLATPVRDPRAAVGLCLLRAAGKKSPVIVDMRCDDIPVCKDYGKSRDEIYKANYGSD